MPCEVQERAHKHGQATELVARSLPISLRILHLAVLVDHLVGVRVRVRVRVLGLGLGLELGLGFGLGLGLGLGC